MGGHHGVYNTDHSRDATQADSRVIVGATLDRHSPLRPGHGGDPEEGDLGKVSRRR
ncbi:hypothetical protein JAAARDRAFT_71953 [Jaapia argillacea MUCL 33604]|uniref:Uncharacterized protein n=1 Tax=Jaapia argillacea MUCL 33604 TaxID=933084 RepID=A0A067PWH4_9AGAM|nr:hypothetical protein JAAARDRAFT_71953 [Jaapia argillacea MUCL 33604]